MCAVEDRHAIAGIPRQMLFGGVGDEQRFVLRVEGGIQAHVLALGPFGPEFLTLARLVVLHHRAGRRQDGFRRTVVLLQPDGAGLGEIALEIQNVANVRPAPAIDRLVFVPHHAHVAVLLG